MLAEHTSKLLFVRNKWIAAYLVTLGFEEAEQPAQVEDRTTGQTSVHYCFHAREGGKASLILRAWEVAGDAIKKGNPSIVDDYIATLADDDKSIAERVAEYYACLVNAQRLEKNTRQMIRVAHPCRPGITALLPKHYGPERAQEFGLPYPHHARTIQAAVQPIG